MDPLLQSYEELPYLSEPIPQTHPDALATPALLGGMSPAPVEQCRMLEVGCGTAGNLIAMAASLPESRFIGVDLAPGQIAQGRELASALGLTNVELHAGDLSDFDPGGEVDFLVAHGVYSWCPPAVQQALLGLCQRRLAHDGVAYISFNVLPGWRNVGLWRDILRWGGRGSGDLRARVAEARRFFELTAEIAAAIDPEYGEELRNGVNKVGGLLDQDVAHDFMERYNEPLLLQELAARARKKGLQYLGESGRQTGPGDLPPSLREWAPGRVEAEQCLDFVRNTTFRRSLLCRDTIALVPPNASRVAKLRMNGLCEPLSPNPDVKSGCEEQFRGEHGVLKTDMPLVKAILVQLHHEWPRTLDLAELTQKLQEVLDLAGISEDTVAQAVLQLYASNLVALHTWSPRFVLVPGDRPQAGALARVQASRGSAEVTNLRHRSVTLNPFERALVVKLDGTRDREALIAELSGDGSFTPEKDGRTLSDPTELRPLVEASLAPTLTRLARAAMLVA
jgi:methyltransferase-like protein/SAM-dependent methyltransferase